MYHRVDRDNQAQAELTKAAGLYRAMDMTFWLARADEQLAKITG